MRYMIIMMMLAGIAFGDVDRDDATKIWYSQNVTNDVPADTSSLWQWRATEFDSWNVPGHAAPSVATIDVIAADEGSSALLKDIKADRIEKMLNRPEVMKALIKLLIQKGIFSKIEIKAAIKAEL